MDWTLEGMRVCTGGHIISCNLIRVLRARASIMLFRRVDWRERCLHSEEDWGQRQGLRTNANLVLQRKCPAAVSHVADTPEKECIHGTVHRLFICAQSPYEEIVPL